MNRKMIALLTALAMTVCVLAAGCSSAPASGEAGTTEKTEETTVGTTEIIEETKEETTAMQPEETAAPAGPDGPGGPGGPDGPGGPGGPGGPSVTEDCYDVASEMITVTQAASYTITLQLKENYSWAVENGADVTSWLVDAEGNPAVTDANGVATAANTEASALEITLDASKISGFPFNGSGQLYVQPAKGAAVNGEGTGVSTIAKQIGEVQRPAIHAEGEVYGSAFSDGGSCVTSETPGGAVAYEGEGVRLILSMDGLDNSKIDSSHASATLMAADGYFLEELDLKATTLAGQWADGQLTYNLADGDLVWNTDEYPAAADGQGREWSCFGGDGSGNYYFPVKVSGITYDGLPVSDQTVMIHVYIYGRAATDLAVMNFGTLKPSWSWEGEGEKPILCDAYEDDFILRWPAGVDASGLTEKDISVVLKGAYGDELALEAGKDFVLNMAAAGKTEVAVRYQHWSFTPVYTTMTIRVNGEVLAYDSENYKLGGLENTYDIASVYAYSIQSGGTAQVDHAVCFAYYGVNLESWEQVQLPVIYRLTVTDASGAVKYYAEDANGKGMLTAKSEEAAQYDGTGAEDYNYKLVDNHLVFMTLRYGQTVEKEVDGTVYTFSKEYASGMPWVKTISPDAYGSIEPVDPTIETLPGYTLGDTWLTHAMWPWTPAFGLGWTEAPAE